MNKLRDYRAARLFGFVDRHFKFIPPKKVSTDKNKKEEGSVIRMIYAPDIDTGLPNSSLPFKLSRSNSDAVRSVINDFILKKLPHHSSDADADTALEFTNERNSQYGLERRAYQEKLISAVQSDMFAQQFDSNSEGTE